MAQLKSRQGASDSWIVTSPVKPGSSFLTIRGKKFRQYRIIDLFDQAEKDHQLCADACDRTESTEGGTQVQSVTEQMKHEIELIVSGDGVLTRVVGVLIVLETLVQMGLALGTVECVRGFVLLGKGRIGFALQLAAPVKEVLIV